ncbi:MAG: GDP-L-fucose synthase family protein [Verrucomicrobiales bacterium]
MVFDSNQKIYVAGHRGMVGKALVRRLESLEAPRLITVGREEVDLTQQAAAGDFLRDEKPDVVVVAAARVGGIHANDSYPAEFNYENLMIAANLVHAAYQAGVSRLLFLGSSCIYPRMAPQPMAEECLLSGPLESTNEAYAIAKIAGLKLCQYYRRQYGILFHSAMPTNLYGPGDNYHPENSHVLPALIRRFHQAKQEGQQEVVIWGTGSPRREFLHVDDLADACIHLLGLEDPPDWINVGTGVDVSILELAQLVAGIVGFEGRITPDPAKPDGTPRKLMDVSRLTAAGWSARIGLEQGLRRTYDDFLREMAGGESRAV